MFVTLTANPSVDRTLVLDSLRRGGVHRARSVSVEPSGKGINVARALAVNGCRVTAVVPLGGPAGERLAALLRGTGLTLAPVPVAAEIRSNVTLLEAGGVATKINEPGPHLVPDEVEALLSTVEGTATGGAWTVCSGSLPPGVADDFYARVIARVHGRGGRAAVDASGVPLRRAAESGADLLKPNREELAELAGHPLDTVGDAVEAANELRRLGAGAVLVSLGPDGALLAGAGVYHAESEPVEVVSPVGAGDALLAGFLAGLVAAEPPPGERPAIAGGRAAGALRTAVAWAVACCASPNCEIPPVPAESPVKIIVTEHPDLTRRLSAG